MPFWAGLCALFRSVNPLFPAHRPAYALAMILQRTVPYDLPPRPLPGIQPLGDRPWMMVDDAYAAQMAERVRLIRDHRDDVIATTPQAMPALAELYETVLNNLPAGFTRTADHVTRPDGQIIVLEPADPLGTLGHLVQEDLCLLTQPEGADQHVLSAAVLCFPASWRLSEKIGRPLTQIHDPVPEYDADLARRVQRLFDAIHCDRPLWRSNALWYDDPTLFQPRSASLPKTLRDPARAPFFRSERQCLLRLPKTRAVVFAIHTIVLARADVPEHLLHAGQHTH